MHIHALPVETLLQIIGYLPIQSICTLESVSQTFLKFVRGNLNAIYLVAARLHRFAPQSALACGPQAALKVVVATLGSKKWLQEIGDWKQFCKNSFLLEQAWSFSCRGDHPMYRRMETPGVNRIRHDEDFQVDEVEQTVIVTRDTGEIEVVSIETGEQVWKCQGAPPPNQAMTPPLLKFGKGFLIFSQVGSNLIDVWRRSTDCYDLHSYLPSRPTNDQLARSPDTAAAFSSGYLPIDGSSKKPTSPLTTCSLQTSAQLPRQGVFLPFTQIAYQQRFSKCCYTHPYLAVLRDSFPRHGLSVVDIWHLPTLQRSARLCVDRDIRPVVDIAVGPTYLYVAASQRIVAYKWTSAIPDESGEPVFLPAYPQFVMPQPHTNQLPMFLCERINRDDAQESGNYTATGGSIDMVPFTPFALPTNIQPMDLIDERSWMLEHRFSDIAVSPAGTDLVAIVGSCWVVYLANFTSRGSANSKTHTKEGRIVFAFAIGRKSEYIPRRKRLSTAGKLISHVAFDGHRILVRNNEGVFAAVVKDRRILEAAHQLDAVTSPHLKPPFTICGVEPPHLGSAYPGTCTNLLNGSAWFTTATTAIVGSPRHIRYIDFTDFGGVDVGVGANDSGIDEDEASGRGSAGGA